MGEWLKQLERQSPKLRLEQLCGCGYWKQLFESCIPDQQLDEHYGVGNTNAFLLYGPEGVGKRTLALACAGTWGDAGYRFLVFPRQSELENEERGIQQIVTEIFQEIIKELRSSENGYFLLIEDIHWMIKEKKTAEIFKEKIQEMEEENLLFTVIGILEHIEEMDDSVKKYFLPCRLENPDQEERRIYLENVFEGRIPRSNGLSYSFMVEKTEGFLYQQMSDLSRLAGMLLKQKALQLYGNRRTELTEAWNSSFMVEKTEGFLYQQMSDLSRLAGMLLKQKALQLYGNRRTELTEAWNRGTVCLTKDLFLAMVKQLENVSGKQPIGLMKKEEQEIPTLQISNQEEQNSGSLADQAEDTDFMKDLLDMDLEDF